jgi:hypothetical protein
MTRHVRGLIAGDWHCLPRRRRAPGPRIEQPPTWLASVNAAYLGEYLDRDLAMRRVEWEIQRRMELTPARLGGASDWKEQRDDAGTLIQ